MLIQRQSIGNAASATVSFADIESSKYKRRRRELPILPIDANDVVPRMDLIRNVQWPTVFFRGTVNSLDARIALNTQLYNLKYRA